MDKSLIESLIKSNQILIHKVEDLIDKLEQNTKHKNQMSKEQLAEIVKYDATKYKGPKGDGGLLD